MSDTWLATFWNIIHSIYLILMIKDSKWVFRKNIFVFLFFLNFLIFILFYFTILYWFCHTLTWICHGCTWVPNPERPLPPPTPYHLSGSSLCTSPKHPVSCIEYRLVIRFLHDSIYVSVSFSQIISTVWMEKSWGYCKNKTESQRQEA